MGEFVPQASTLVSAAEFGWGAGFFLFFSAVEFYEEMKNGARADGVL